MCLSRMDTQQIYKKENQRREDVIKISTLKLKYSGLKLGKNKETAVAYLEMASIHLEMLKYTQK